MHCYNESLSMDPCQLVLESIPKLVRRDQRSRPSRETSPPRRPFHTVSPVTVSHSSCLCMPYTSRSQPHRICRQHGFMELQSPSKFKPPTSPYLYHGKRGLLWEEATEDIEGIVPIISPLSSLQVVLFELYDFVDVETDAFDPRLVMMMNYRSPYEQWLVANSIRGGSDAWTEGEKVVLKQRTTRRYEHELYIRGLVV
ncbi:hypothetical protein PLICRDRAFT_51521 [Plicaturopsis crispa FD-325 SS-3]|nr:hypothetical protein PLICRDRAFT_51521 [Plicaturopsis crispa FD-325 SS-3]